MTLSLVSFPPLSRSLARFITSSRWSLPLPGDRELYLIPVVILAKFGPFPPTSHVLKGGPPSSSRMEWRCRQRCALSVVPQKRLSGLQGAVPVRGWCGASRINSTQAPPYKWRLNMCDCGLNHPHSAPGTSMMLLRCSALLWCCRCLPPS